jgi:hypothetical protein
VVVLSLPASPGAGFLPFPITDLLGGNTGSET